MANPSSAARKIEPQKPSAARWEYFVAKLDPSIRSSEAAILASASDGGWELVSVTESANFDRRYYFKRPL